MRGLALILCAATLVTGTNASGQADTPASAPTLASEAVNPEAVAALKRMSDYLKTLKSFQLTAHSTRDLVTVDNQRLQTDAVVQYKVMRPGIWVHFDSDLKDREFYFNGKNFTIYAPKLNFYATAPAPATNAEFIKAIYDKFGISLPLEDLFRWNDGDDSDLQALTSGFSVGTARIDGVRTDHWAFRQGDYDWEVWIEQGDRPLPRKLVIVDRTDPALPAYSARLNWVLNPPLSVSDFTFVPGKDAKQIQLATLVEDKK